MDTAVVASSAEAGGSWRTRGRRTALAAAGLLVSAAVVLALSGGQVARLSPEQATNPVTPGSMASSAYGSERMFSLDDSGGADQKARWSVTDRNPLQPKEQWKVVHEGSPLTDAATDMKSWRQGYKWAITRSHVDRDGWGPCYPACGPSVQFREVVCIRSDQTIVDDSFCNKGEKPQLSQQCFNHSLCTPCWDVGVWGACEDAEGCSVKSRTVRCRMCEPEAPRPSQIPSPLTTIGWSDWTTAAQKRGVSGQALKLDETSFADLGLSDAEVCIYGNVGVCNLPRTDDGKEDWSVANEERKTASYFCGFNTAPEDCTQQLSAAGGYVERYGVWHDRLSGYDCNVMAYAVSELSLKDGMIESCDDHGDVGEGCREMTHERHPTYPSTHYWQMGPFDPDTLKPLEDDKCVNFCMADYEWWTVDEEDPSANICYNTTWDAEDGHQEHGCFVDRIVGAEAGRQSSPNEWVDLGADHPTTQCGYGFTQRAYRCCRNVLRGTCAGTQDTPQPQGCYCEGAVHIFDKDTPSYDPNEHADLHPESYCQLELHDAEGTFSNLFKRSVPVIKRAECVEYEQVMECEAYPTVNSQWPPPDLKPDGAVLLEVWVDEYLTCFGDGPNDDSGRNSFSMPNFNCKSDLLGDTCETCEVYEGCTGVWVCNCWRDCQDESMSIVANKTDPGYVMPRAPMQVAVVAGGSVSLEVNGETMVFPITLQDDCEECSAHCAMVGQQCRQCWCEAFPSAISGNAVTEEQEQGSNIDTTGEACYRPWDGYGSPKPKVVRSCTNDAHCPWAPCTQRWEICDADCGFDRNSREVGCCRIDGVRGDESNCHANPTGTDWELIMQIGDDADDQPFHFGASYWENAQTILNAECIDKGNRKLHAFNSKKFNRMKMCFGFGFAMENPDFEEDAVSQPNTPMADLPDGLTGWQITGTDAALFRSGAEGANEVEAPSGALFLGLSEQTAASGTIYELTQGLLTYVSFEASSVDSQSLASVQVSINDQLYYVIDSVSFGGWMEYRFHFVPSQGSVTLKIENTAEDCDGYCLLLDNVRVESEGYELVAQELRGESGALADLSVVSTADSAADAAMGGATFNIGPQRVFRGDWDEMMIIWGDTHDIADTNGDDTSDRYYIFKPSSDIFGVSDFTEDIRLSALRSNDVDLLALTDQDGGANWCQVPSAEVAAWSINPIGDDMSPDVSVAGDIVGPGGCARDECMTYNADGVTCDVNDYRGDGAYYAGSNYFGGFVGTKQEGQPKGFTEEQWATAQAADRTLQIFVRQTSAHGGLDETQRNCVEYAFPRMWDNATALFSAGEMLASESDTPIFYQSDFNRVFAQPKPGDDGRVCEMGKPGFNIGIRNWDCNNDDSHTAVADRDRAVFARWGYFNNEPCKDCPQSSQLYPDVPFDGATGIGLFSYSEAGSDSCQNGRTGEMSDKVGAGYTHDFMGDRIPKFQKAWIWVTDTTQNPLVEGFQLLPPYDWNDPQAGVLRGSDNIFPSVEQCKLQCSEMDNCAVGVFVTGTERQGECWLASRKANISDTSFCGSTRANSCVAFEKKPELLLRDCNAYVYSRHAVVAGGDRWDLSKYFETGVKFEIKGSDDPADPTLFGPVTVRETISKQFTYGKQTYIYWDEDVQSTKLERKCIYTHKRKLDQPIFLQWPGRIHDCTAGDSTIYMSIGQCYQACLYGFSNQGDCQGFSAWMNPEILINGGFEQFQVSDGDQTVLYESTDNLGWEVEVGMPAIIKRNTVFPKLPPYPFVCRTCDQVLHLNGMNAEGSDDSVAGVEAPSVFQTFETTPGHDYIVSFWVTAGFKCQRGTDNPRLKTATVKWNDLTLLDIVVDTLGWTSDNYRWKMYTLEINAAAHAAKLMLIGTNSGCGGVIIDQVSVREAHASAIDGRRWGENDECAALGQSLNVEPISEQMELDVFTLNDRAMVERYLCPGRDRSLEAAEYCQSYAGTILDESHSRRYTVDDTNFVHVWGGVSALFDSTIQDETDPVRGNHILQCVDGFSYADVTPSPTAAWTNGISAFKGLANGGIVTVYTFRLIFAHHTQILNVKIEGAYFTGSVFKLLGRTRNLLAMQSTNLEGDSFGDECQPCAPCTVIVPGSDVTTDDVYYLEESNTEQYARIRTSFCVRTPVCSLHTEKAIATADRTGMMATRCTDGLLAHVDGRDRNFRSHIAEDKCRALTSEDADVHYGLPLHMGPDRSVKVEAFGEGLVSIGLFSFEQDPVGRQTRNSCELNPAYYVDLDLDSSKIYHGWPNGGGVVVAQGDTVVEQIDNDHGRLVWIDLRLDESRGTWTLRVGSTRSASSIEELIVGSDTLLTWDIPADAEVIDMSHVSVRSDERVEWRVCTTGKPGRPAEQRVCIDYGNCPCAWKQPVDWEELECSENCGDGHLVRETECLISQYELDSVQCKALGMACQLMLDTFNPTCRVQFFDLYAYGYGPTNIDDNYEEGEHSRVFSSGEMGDLNDSDFMLDDIRSEVNHDAVSMDHAVSSMIVDGAGCSVLMWDTPGRIGEVFELVVPDGYTKVVAAAAPEPSREEDREDNTFYLDISSWDFDNKASSFAVADYNHKYCDPNSKPATSITCHEERGCCGVCVYGEWGAGSNNVQEVDGTMQKCMREDNTPCCGTADGNACGVQTRDVQCEWRRYRCDEWGEDMFDELDSYYLTSTVTGRAMFTLKMEQYIGSADRPICKKKSYIETIGTIDWDTAHAPLSIYQYMSGCPETNYGGDRNYGAVAIGSDLLETNKYYPNRAGDLECSGDSAWFNAIGTTPKGCPAPDDDDKRVGEYPHKSEACSTDFWCTCHWHQGSWGPCVGCGDIIQYRKSECRRADYSEDTGGPIIDCPASVLTTYGQCCYSPEYYSGCGGCTANSRPTASQHCHDWSQCTYEWHVKTGSSLCDHFTRCVPWDSWEVDGRFEGSAEEKEEWCTTGPQRQQSSDDFVTYGLGACWAENTRKSNKNFITAADPQWAAHGYEECPCFFGADTMFGNNEFGRFPFAVAANEKYAQLFQMTEAGWLMKISVATEGAGAAVKGAVYADKQGQPGQRIAVTEVGETTQEANWVHMRFPQWNDGRGSSSEGMEDEAGNFGNEQLLSTKGVYLGSGRYWLSVIVGGPTQLLATTSGSIVDGSDSVLPYVKDASDVYDGSASSSPSNPFGPVEAVSGGFSIYASYTPDDNVHVYPDLQIDCHQSSDTCEQCMRTITPESGERCVWILKEGAGRDDIWNCEPKSYAQQKGLVADESCHPSWGADNFLEMDRWNCDGSQAKESPRADQSAGDVFADGMTVEACAEDCLLANTHWKNWEGPNAVGDWVAPFYCEGFSFEAMRGRCTLFSDVQLVEVDESDEGFGGARCFVQKELPNPCSFSTGDWIRASDGVFYYVGASAFLYEIDMTNGVPVCNGLPIFGEADAKYPRDGFCNGYGIDPVEGSPVDDLCNGCVQQMMDHNMLVGTITGSAESCEDFGTKMVHACQNDDLTLSCRTGTMTFVDNDFPATYARMEDKYCADLPSAGEFTSASVATSGGCGEAGNVQDIISTKCEGHQSCTISATDEQFGDQSCADVFKYFQVSYECQ